MAENELVVYGTAWCSDCKRSKKFLGEQRIQYSWVDVDDDPAGMAFIEKVQNGGHSVPTLVFPDGEILIEPSNADLARKLKINTKAKNEFYEVIIIGGGPAGLTAALYTAREGYSTMVLDRAGMGGQAAITECLDNFPGFPEGISGDEFAHRLVEQAQRFGVELVAAQSVVKLEQDGVYNCVTTADGSEYRARAVLIATGSNYKRLGAVGEDGLIGSSVHYCATCDGPFYRGKRIAVVGGGNSAVEESMFLTNFVSDVTILVRGDKLSASKFLTDKLAEEKNVHVLYNTEIVELKGKPKLKELVVRDRTTGVVRDLEPAPAGVFAFIGLTPNTGWLPDTIKLSADGSIITTATLETSLPGVFAAGDVRQDSTKQAASAAGEGATAALMIRNYLRKMG